jgi:dodecin
MDRTGEQSVPGGLQGLDCLNQRRDFYGNCQSRGDQGNFHGEFRGRDPAGSRPSPQDAPSCSQRMGEGTAASVEGDEIAESQVDLVITLKRKFLAIARVEEIRATSTVSFEDAIRQGLARAGNTLHQVRGGWVKERQVRVEADKIVEYQVNLPITFMMDD